ncbi:hypothetical protein BKH42_03525 [Helicobacter sp. 13S00482-2]|uniref:hypothetical protein n=1 Tax=Helicobacter sp. 13S00482-2 TaxID=1476200 RepID=UPI000BA70CD2|nr:hypothetical protein [Helicobacter sp. 13S00482-2]PAF53811.1 hypothetical protein BKH42_03525 [Helicobacter sp. 13S00482-2]
MKKNTMKRSFIVRVLLLFSLLGVSFCFGANLFDAVTKSIFDIAREYFLPIVIFITGVAALGLFWAGVQMKWIVASFLIVVLGWVFFTDFDLILGAINFLSSFVKKML